MGQDKTKQNKTRQGKTQQGKMRKYDIRLDKTEKTRKDNGKR